MKRILFIAAMLLVATVTVSAQDVKGVAILKPVDEVGDVPPGVKLQLRGALTYAISHMPGYEAYTRVNLSAIMDEHKFQRDGFVSNEQIKKLGQMTGASYVLVAEAAVFDANNITVTATIYDVETGKVIEASQPETAPTDPVKMKEACIQIARTLLGKTGGSSGSYNTSVGGGTAQQGQDFTETALGVNMRMIYVEGGTFTMGCTGEQGGECEEDERPVRMVTLTGYYMGATEVTVGQFKRFVSETGYRTDAEKEGWAWRWMPVVDGKWQWNKVAGVNWMYDANGNVRNSSEDNHPVLYVSWNDANEFCKWLSKKTGRNYGLPTEAEWEYAARGGSKSRGYKYGGSNNINDVAWYGNSGTNSTANGRTHAVGTKYPNELGIYDMSGNVNEWCQDWYGSYGSSSQTDPTGPYAGSYRVLRGGCWSRNARYCRVAIRDGSTPSSRYSLSGFRVVLH